MDPLSIKGAYMMFNDWQTGKLNNDLVKSFSTAFQNKINTPNEILESIHENITNLSIQTISFIFITILFISVIILITLWYNGLITLILFCVILFLIFVVILLIGSLMHNQIEKYVFKLNAEVSKKMGAYTENMFENIMAGLSAGCMEYSNKRNSMIPKEKMSKAAKKVILEDVIED